MGNCLGSSTQVGSLQQVGSPSQLGCLNLRPLLKHDRKEIYEKLTTIFRKSYDYVNNLQQTFAAKEMPNSTAIRDVKKRVTKYSMMTKLSNEEAEQIAENTNKVLERYWFKRSKKIISSVINRLKDVIVSTDQQPTLSTLISKLETDCLQWLETAINQLSKDILEAKSTDEGENGRNESVDGLETGQTIEGPYDDKTEVFRLLFTCTLILGTERDNYSEICLYV